MMTPRMSAKNLHKGSPGSQIFLVRVFVVTLTLVALAGTTFLVLSLYLFLKGTSFLRVKEVEIEGNNRVSREKILAITGLDDNPNLLSLDLKASNRRLGEDPWIEKSMIKRVFPDGIHIVIQERKPLALIHLGRFYYIDETGVIFDRAHGKERAGYPILTGIRRGDLETGERKTRMLLQSVIRLLKMTRDRKTVVPYPSISQIHLDRAVGLLMYTTDRKTEFRMGFDGFERKFRRLSRIWSVIRPMDLDYIDCTIPDRVIVKQKRGRRG